ncbi:10945_t:CDS:2 [Entrophospora sp. SA101]|nr:10945_t:CDS:2 [Entrophospora sp. SA101]
MLTYLVIEALGIYSALQIPINFPNINPENLVKEIEVIIKINGIKLNENLRPLGIGLSKDYSWKDICPQQYIQK